MVQKLGKKVEEQENRYIELNKDVNFHGARETKVLMEEADGVIIKKQKRCKGSSKNFEIKLALFHEGWKQTGTNRYELAETLETISKITLPDKFNERITDVLSASKISKKVGKGYAGKICSMPYETTAVTESRKCFRNWLKGAKTMNF